MAVAAMVSAAAEFLRFCCAAEEGFWKNLLQYLPERWAAASLPRQGTGVVNGGTIAA